MSDQQRHFGGSTKANQSRRHKTGDGTKLLDACFMVLFALLLAGFTWFFSEVTAMHASSSAAWSSVEMPAVFDTLPVNVESRRTREVV